jgi:hypothetical protein
LIFIINYELNRKNAFTITSSATISKKPLYVPAPQGIWKGEDNGLDSSGNGGHMYTTGGATFAAGRVGRAFVFGSGNGASIASNSFNNFGGKNITVSAWFNWNGYTGNTDMNDIVRKTYAGGTNLSPWSMYDLLLDKSNGTLVFYAAGVGQAVSSAGAISPNTWYHGLATYDGSNVKLYINGTLVATSAATANIGQSGGPLVIGGAAESGNNNGMKGMIDEVKIWNVALTPEQIQAVYSATS